MSFCNVELLQCFLFVQYKQTRSRYQPNQSPSLPHSLQTHTSMGKLINASIPTISTWTLGVLFIISSLLDLKTLYLSLQFISQLTQTSVTRHQQRISILVISLNGLRRPFSPFSSSQVVSQVPAQTFLQLIFYGLLPFFIPPLSFSCYHFLAAC